MKISIKAWSFIGALACTLAVLGECLVNWRLQTLYVGYDPYRLSLSYLGRSDSPVLDYVKIWGVTYTVLLLVFTWCLYQVFQPAVRLLLLVVALWSIYALGEGIGSAFFPFDHVNGQLTFTAKIHNVVSGFGDAAFFVLPLLMTRLFSSGDWPAAKTWATYTIGLGLLLMALFLLSKWLHPTSGLFALAGLWQRLFLLVYYSFLLLFSYKLARLKR